MLAPYAAVLRARGGPAFSAAGFVARLPISMVGLAMVLLVSARSGSYGLAGAVSAAYLLLTSVTAPLQARLADRLGQAAVLWPALGGQVVGYAVFLAAAHPRLVPWQLFAGAALVGATQPQIGSMVRARWSAVLGGTPLLHTAYALESVLDEGIFVLGPVLVTLLATQVHPRAALLLTLTLAVLGGAALAVQRSTQPPVGGTASGPRPGLPLGALLALVLGFLALGAVFGSTDVSVVAVADAAGRRAAAGAILACFAGGSLVAGVVFGTLRWSAPLRTRLLLTHAVLALVTLPLPFVRGLGPLVAVAVLGGLAVSPTLVTGFSLVEAVVAPVRLTEGLAWATSALGAGVALGAALAGRVVDAAGANAGFWVTVAAAVLAVLPAGAAQIAATPGMAPWTRSRAG